jgi:hypothetical protein
MLPGPPLRPKSTHFPRAKSGHTAQRVLPRDLKIVAQSVARWVSHVCTTRRSKSVLIAFFRDLIPISKLSMGRALPLRLMRPLTPHLADSERSPRVNRQLARAGDQHLLDEGIGCCTGLWDRSSGGEKAFCVDCSNRSSECHLFS